MRHICASCTRLCTNHSGTIHTHACFLTLLITVFFGITPKDAKFSSLSCPWGGGVERGWGFLSPNCNFNCRSCNLGGVRRFHSFNLSNVLCMILSRFTPFRLFFCTIFFFIVLITSIYETILILVEYNFTLLKTE